MSNNKKAFGQKLRKGLHLFKRAYQKTKSQLGVSLVILLLVTIFLVLAMLLAETTNDNFSFWDALVWPLVKYVEDPADITKPPLTVVGKFVGTLVGIMGVAIFAVPAGLIGSGLISAMEEQEREQKLDKMRKRLHKSFRRSVPTNLREYIKEYNEAHSDLPFSPHNVNVVPAYRTVGWLQVRQGMDIKDISDTCRKFAEFRLQDLSRIESKDDMTMASNFIVETFPLNRKYGCCINRQSKVTILCTDSWDQVGMGRFCYYLAKFGGFNYISKEIEVYPDEVDSFYYFSKEPLYNGKEIVDFDPKDENFKEAKDVVERKRALRDQFFDDLKDLTRDGQWLVIVGASKQNSTNLADIHLNDRGNHGVAVENQELYSDFCNQLDKTMKEEFDILTEKSSSLYPFRISKKTSPLAKNIAYWIHEEFKDCDCFTMRPALQLVNSSRSLRISFRIAMLIREMLETVKDDKGLEIQAEDEKDLTTLGFGFSELAKNIDDLVKPVDLDD